MASEITSITLTHERDAAWLIALYLAIHGGDPAPDEGKVVEHEVQQGAAIRAIIALTQALDQGARTAVQEAIAPLQKQSHMKTVDPNAAGKRLQAMGIRIAEYSEKAHAQEVKAESFRIRPYCIRFRGQIICVEIPSPFPQPHA